MQKTALACLTLVTALVGAGCSAASRCPPEFPEERDGFCYAPDGGARLDTGATDGGGGTDGGGMGTDTPGADVPATDAAVICTGTHPIVEGTRRYCNAGDCFCGDPDNCFPADTASACCSVAVVCEGTDGGMAMQDAPSVICTGTHPLLMGTRRYCNPGDCFCADPDSCFPADTASSCCNVAVVCE